MHWLEHLSSVSSAHAQCKCVCTDRQVALPCFVPQRAFCCSISENVQACMMSQLLQGGRATLHMHI